MMVPKCHLCYIPAVGLRHMALTGLASVYSRQISNSRIKWLIGHWMTQSWMLPICYLIPVLLEDALPLERNMQLKTRESRCLTPHPYQPAKVSWLVTDRAAAQKLNVHALKPEGQESPAHSQHSLCETHCKLHQLPASLLLCQSNWSDENKAKHVECARIC